MLLGSLPFVIVVLCLLGFQNFVPGTSQFLQDAEAGFHLFRVPLQVCFHEGVEAKGIDTKEIFGYFSARRKIQAGGEFGKNALGFSKVLVLGREVFILDRLNALLAMANSGIIEHKDELEGAGGRDRSLLIFFDELTLFGRHHRTGCGSSFKELSAGEAAVFFLRFPSMGF